MMLTDRHRRPIARPAARPNARAVERLEPRTLLSAMVISSIPSQDIQSSVGSGTINLGTYLNDPQITGGTVVEIQTPLGNIPLQLTDSTTPQTVANFVHYITSGEYANTIIHRSLPGFIIQGGGFYTDGSEVLSFGDIPSEAGFLNVTGTIAVALSSGPDTGNTNWFINLANNDGSTPGNPNLDDASDGGPFTVFGSVIDNGMSVVGKIAKLETVNDQQSGAFSSLPVQNYSGSTSPTTVDPANMITTNPVIIPTDQAAPQYSVVSSNPAVMGASVSNGVLTLTAGAGLTQGFATITATVTDVAGETASSSFIASINGSDVPITIGAGGAKSASYTDDNGTTATVTLKGPGSAQIDFHSQTALTQTSTKKGVTVGGSGISIAQINTTGTTGASVLMIATRGGTRIINIGNLNTQDLKGFSARGAVLTGSINASGSIGALSLNSAAGGQINLVFAGTIKTKGNLANSMIQLSAAGLDVKNIAIGGTISGSTLNAIGGIGSVTAASLENSQIYAGIGPLVLNQVLPNVPTDFATSETIGSVRLRSGAAAAFANSDIAALNIGKLSLGNVQTNNGGQVTGVASENITSFVAVIDGKRFSLRNVTLSTDIATILTKLGVTLGDFVIKLF